MGCDIHMYVEYRKDKDSKWQHGDYYKHVEVTTWEPSGFERLELHGDRNYTLFATLAGVRDYSDENTPVSDPKGLPRDVSERVLKEFKEWGLDAHSESYLSLFELRKYQKGNPSFKYTGLLSPDQQIALDLGVIPSSWCQGTNQEGFKRREWFVPNTSLVPLIDKMQTRAFELIHWGWETYDVKNDDNIRIVFWFNN